MARDSIDRFLALLAELPRRREPSPEIAALAAELREMAADFELSPPGVVPITLTRKDDR